MLLAVLCASTAACVNEPEPLADMPEDVAERVEITALDCHMAGGVVTVEGTFDITMDEGKAFTLAGTQQGARHDFQCFEWQTFGFGDGDEAGCQRLPGMPATQTVDVSITMGAVAGVDSMRLSLSANVVAEPFGPAVLLDVETRVLDCY